MMSANITLHMASWQQVIAEIVICDYPHLSKLSRELNRSQKAASENGAYVGVLANTKPNPVRKVANQAK
jgi:hypothetical protein